MEKDMTNLFRIRDLDLADTEGLPAFIHFCQDHDVEILWRRGPNGYPTCTLIAGRLEALIAVLVEYCGGDEKAAADLDDMIEVV
jgi:hypothetical protein